MLVPWHSLCFFSFRWIICGIEWFQQRDSLYMLKSFERLFCTFDICLSYFVELCLNAILIIVCDLWFPHNLAYLLDKGWFLQLICWYRILHILRLCRDFLCVFLNFKIRHLVSDQDWTKLLNHWLILDLLLLQQIHLFGQWNNLDFGLSFFSLIIDFLIDRLDLELVSRFNLCLSDLDFSSSWVLRTLLNHDGRFFNLLRFLHSFNNIHNVAA